MEPDHNKRAQVCDFLLKMYAEQSGYFRHYETQRSTATAILTSMAAALLGLTGALWGHYGIFVDRALPVTCTLMAVGLTGYILTYKLFERSRVHHSLAEAYLNTVNAAMRDEVGAVITPEIVQTIAYVRNAREAFTGGSGERPLFEIAFDAGKKKRLDMSPADLRGRIDRHVPVDPREIAIPVHNASMGWIVGLQTWKLWLHLFIGIFIFGALVSGLTLMIKAS
ncbi:MAG TPA: hypothetical protein VF535_13315 [Allosphingosinicella sp.]